jgi:Flp pilus assembly protein TadD
VRRFAPNEPSLHYKAGMLAMLRGRNHEAAASFRTVLASRPYDREARINLASSLTMEGLVEEAAGEYAFLLERYPTDSGVLTGYGGFLASQGKMGEALEVLERALESEPGNQRAQAMAARVRSELDL